MYQALYRKWRPLEFDDVVEQTHIKKTLQNQIATGKTAHAYLFTGSRGTGKTTFARIFAKTINCLNSKDGSPCLECEICKGADEGTLSDIIEIDAASNTGVDDIRELKESTAFMPEKCKFKVYIIDEVHMLSTSAFNALLKILEEPPAHVKFILATTEVHKVPATIVSRCQRFDFRRFTMGGIVSRLMYVANAEKINLDENAAALIAKLSDGGMRDALSLLDQCLSYSNDVNIDTVSNAAGIASRDYVFDLIECIKNNDPTKAISIIDKLYEMSKDVSRLCEEILSQLRNLMILKTVSGKDDLLNCLPEEISRLREIANGMDVNTILAKLSIIQDCNERLPRVNSKRVEIEMCFVKLCTEIKSDSLQKNFSVDNETVKRLEDRIIRLEKALANGERISSDFNRKAQEPLFPQNQSPVPMPVVDATKVTTDTLKPIQDWSEIVDKIGRASTQIGGFLSNSQGFEKDNACFIIVHNDFFLEMVKKTDVAKVIQDVLKEHLGKTYNIGVKSAKNVMPDDVENPLNMLKRKAQDAGIEVNNK